MALSYAQYAGNGSTTTFSVPFPYILKAHVKVYIGFNILNGTFTSELVDGTNFVWTSSTQIQCTTAPAVGQTLTVIRQTPSSSRLVDWNDGSNLIAADMDTADLQNLYVVQEQQDRNDSGITQSTSAINTATSAAATATAAAATVATAYLKDGSVAMTGNVATGGYRITNVGTPVSATDGATKGYVDAFQSQTANIADAAVTTAKLADGAVTSAKIADGTIAAADLAADAVTTAKILNANVTEAKLATDSVSTTKIVNGAVTTAKVADANITEAKLATDAVTVNKIKDGEITSAKLNPATVVTNAEVAGVSPNDTSFYTTSASDQRYFRQDTSETINSGMAWSGSDSFIATTAAIDARIIDLVDDVGGFVPIANETSFPATNPDINNPDGTGTIVSIKEIVTTRTPAGGTVTIAGGSGANTVTITGCGSTVLPAGFGVLVETTATLHTYTFHRLTPKATEVTTVASISGDVTTVAANSSNVTTVASNSASVTTVATNIANINTVQSNIGNINTAATNIGNVNAVGNSIANVNTVGGSIANVNTVAGVSGNVTTVAGSIGSVNTAAGSIANINTAAGSIANVNTAATNIANINTVAGINGNVTTVAGISGNVTTVATNTANINTAASYLNAFLALYLGAATADPAVDGLGNPITTGDLYLNSNLSQVRVYNGTAWQSFAENAFANTSIVNADFTAVYTATAGTNVINLGDLTVTGGIFPDENTPTKRMSLASGAGSYNLGGI